MQRSIVAIQTMVFLSLFAASCGDQPADSTRTTDTTAGDAGSELDAVEEPAIFDASLETSSATVPSDAATDAAMSDAVRASIPDVASLPDAAPVLDGGSECPEASTADCTLCNGVWNCGAQSATYSACASPDYPHGACNGAVDAGTCFVCSYTQGYQCWCETNPPDDSGSPEWLCLPAEATCGQ